MANNNQDKINRLRKLADLIYSKELMDKIGQAYATLVKRRTQKGRDIHGDRFAGYVDSYKKRRKRLGEPVGLVNLTIDHAQGMLQQIDYLVLSDISGVQAFINGTGNPPKDKLGRWHQTGAGDLPKREWWGLSEQQQLKLKDIIATDLDEIFKANL